MGGKAGLLLLGVALAPVLLKKSKHLAKYVGQQLVDLGEYLKKDDDPVAEPAPTAPPSPEAQEIQEAEIVEDGEESPESTEVPTPSTEPELPKEFQPEPSEE